jgi:hypothetical protein
MNTTAVLKSFERKKIVTLEQLTNWLGCSIPTARRRLKQWRACTSYNHNGRYYTLPAIPEFDTHGLWRYRGVFFSKYGNLKQTLVQLVTQSERGLSAADLGERLGLQPRSFLSHFRHHPALYREEREGRWIWFAADPQRRNQQQHSRLTQVVTKAPPMPSDIEAVMILVDLLHHPNSRLEAMVQRLKQKGHAIDVEAIHTLLAHHDLLKKTADFQSSKS